MAKLLKFLNCFNSFNCFNCFECFRCEICVLWLGRFGCLLFRMVMVVWVNRVVGKGGY